MKACLLLLLLLSTRSLRAELAIYNFTGSTTVIGNGTATAVRPRGVLIWDVDSGQAVQVAVFHVGALKRLIVDDQSASRLFQCTGPRASSYTAVCSQSLTNTGALTTESASFTFGRNALLRLRPGRDILLPRTARNTGFAISQLNSDGLTYIGPASGVYSFSAKTSAAVNGDGWSLAAAVQHWRNKYAALGYGG